MSNIMGVLNVAGDQILFWCPGCDAPHAISVKLWVFDGNYDAPTFTPSVLVHGHKTLINDDLEGDALFAPENITMTPQCHSFVNQGRIEFLSDSTHPLAGQTVELPAWPKEYA
jgi:hypothetical protein